MTYHQYLDRYNEYDGVTNIYTINHTDGPLVIDEILFDAIEYGIEKSDLVTYQDTSLFNIALGPVLDVWHNARNNDECDTTIEFGVTYCPVPNDEITNGVFNTDPSKIQLDRENLTITLTESNMSLDLGGYGKGYVSKVVTDYLDTLDLIYLLNLGQSNVVSGGINPTNDTGLFYIALTEPKTEFALQTDYYHIMQMPEGLSLVTSGVNQRYFKGLDDSLVYHHIIDPSTNHPGGYSMSVTVISHDPALADVLSTAVFLLPIDEAISFVNNTSDLEAVWYISKDEIIYSDNFLDYVFQ
jgi:thiamine biosynthesis lipoprotein